MTEAWKDRLSEYVDDELTADERQEIEEKLAGDPKAAALVEDLRRIRDDASALPDLEPAEDLWSGIEAAMATSKPQGHQPRRAGITPMAKLYSFSAGQLATAAAVLIMVTAGVSTLTTRFMVQGPARVVPADTSNVGSIVDGMSDTRLLEPRESDVYKLADFDSRQRYDASVARLEDVYTQGKASLDSTTVVALERSLAVSDRVIFQARSALEDNPGDPYLSAHLAKAMRHKVKLLKRMANLTQDAN